MGTTVTEAAGGRSRARSRRRPQRWLALLTVAALAAAACGRSDDSTEESEESEQDDGGRGDAAETASSGGRLENGEFGDLGTVCQEGDASGDSDTGVTDDEIHVGTITDKGSALRADLNVEMWDVAEAFVAWCNEQGGINGRQLVLDDLDVRTDPAAYGDAIAESCEQRFALVGGGAVFDNSDAGAREECGLPNIASFVVTPEARAAGAQVQPIPNPVYQWPAQMYRTPREHNPDLERAGVIWVNLPGPATVFQQAEDAYEELGYDVVYTQEAAPQGETGWPSFVAEMRDEDVQIVEYIGEPGDMGKLLNAMQVEGWYPDIVIQQPNMYDQLMIDEAGAALDESTTYVRTIFTPFEQADEHEAVADYLELMDTYNSDGKYPAMLGAQALSSWLLFARSASECGDDLTRQCLLDTAFETSEWTAGGLHAPSQPGNVETTVCGLFLRATSEGFEYDEEFTQPTDGLFNCDEENVLELTGDYGVEAPER